MENQHTREKSDSRTKQAMKDIIQEGGVQIAKATFKSTFPIMVETTGKAMRTLAAIALNLLRR